MQNNKDYFIIVNYNSGSHIVDCITSIIQSINIKPHIIVVDNASKDNSLEKCKKKFPNITYIYNSHNIGFASGANIGARRALEKGARTITFCNPDAYLKKDCAYHLINVVINGMADIVSPIIQDESSKIWFSGGNISFLHMRATHIYQPINKSLITDIDYISGCVMTVSKNVFEKIGLFDEQFFLYYEDADFSLRAQEVGFKLAIIPKAVAFHSEISEQNKEQKTYFLVLSGLIFFDKHTKGIKKTWFHIHTKLRKIKNYFDCKKNKPLSHTVSKAYHDYDTHKQQ
jgi:GT2 family glycosyltransferase